MTRKKYIIDYEWGIAHLYTASENWETRFYELLDNEYERLEHHGDVIVWNEQGEKIKSEWD